MARSGFQAKACCVADQDQFPWMEIKNTDCCFFVLTWLNAHFETHMGKTWKIHHRHKVCFYRQT